MTTVTVYDGAHKRLQKLDSFDANLNSQNANLNSTKRKLDSFEAKTTTPVARLEKKPLSRKPEPSLVRQPNPGGHLSSSVNRENVNLLLFFEPQQMTKYFSPLYRAEISARAKIRHLITPKTSP